MRLFFSKIFLSAIQLPTAQYLTTTTFKKTKSIPSYPTSSHFFPLFSNPSKSKIKYQITTIAQETDTKFRSSFILGGQIKGQSPEIYFIYPEGNCIRATTDTPFFQLGESKYGKPILDRSMNYDASLKSAMRAILISFDSTIRSNLSVGMPIDVLVYHNDSLQMPQGYRIDENDEYFASIRQHWSDGLRKILAELEDSPVSYWQ